MDEGEAHEVPDLSKEQLEVDDYWETENHFSSGILILRGYLFSSRWSRTQAHASLNEQERDREREHKVGGKSGRG